MRSYLRESTPSLTWRDIDLGGVVLSIVALVCLVFGILLLGSPQYWQFVPLFIVVGLIVFAALPPLAKAAHQSPRGTVARYLSA